MVRAEAGAAADNSEMMLSKVIDVISIFPEMFAAITEFGITRRAHEQGLWQLQCWNPRDYTQDRHKTVDDRPYGGGPGMVMKPEPLFQAIGDAVESQRSKLGCVGPVLYLSPQGRKIDHARIVEWSKLPGLILLCGRYEGIDQRVIESCVDEEVSLGDFVLSGGELPAMALIDAVVRQIPGALHDEASAREDSFVEGLLDCPHYTRPEECLGMRVPDILMSGDHAAIARWRYEQALLATAKNRPDLLSGRKLDKKDLLLLASSEKKQGA